MCFSSLFIQNSMTCWWGFGHHQLEKPKYFKVTEKSTMWSMLILSPYSLACSPSLCLALSLALSCSLYLSCSLSPSLSCSRVETTGKNAHLALHGSSTRVYVRMHDFKMPHTPGTSKYLTWTRSAQWNDNGNFGIQQGACIVSNTFYVQYLQVVKGTGGGAVKKPLTLTSTSEYSFFVL